jgi:predicted MFS family arabinose efflux permease
MSEKPWNTSYEWKAITLLTLGFGLVGLDRWIIAPMLPSISKDLGLNYQDAGNIVGLLGVSWGVFAVLAGGLSDRIGRKKVLIPAIVGFSLLSGVSGLATGFMSLLLVRCIMGVTEGSFCPTSFATTNDASKPSRRGFNLGLQQSTFPLFGLALGPIIATQLLQVTSWRWIFVLVAVPGLILAVLLARTIKEPQELGVQGSSAAHERAPWGTMFRQRNVSVGMLGLLCAMSGIFTLSALVPAYLTDYVKLSGTQMGFVTSAIGFGGFLGQVLLPGISDVIGRKPVGLLGFVVGALFIYLFAHGGSSPGALFGLLFVACFCSFGMLGLITGPIAAEAAPRGLVSSTTGIIVGVGEIFGGGVAPSLGGYIAQHYGIQHVLTMAMIGLALGVVVFLFLKETAPRRTAAAAALGSAG